MSRRKTSTHFTCDAEWINKRIVFFEEHAAVGEFRDLLERLKLPPSQTKDLLQAFDEVLKLVAMAGATAEKLDTTGNRSQNARQGKAPKIDKRYAIIAKLIDGKKGSQKAIAGKIYDDFIAECAEGKLKPYAETRVARVIGELRK